MNITVTPVEELIIKAYREVKNGMQKMDFERDGIAVKIYRTKNIIRIDIDQIQLENSSA